MNFTRIVVFCVALMAAGAAVLLVRGMAGGGTSTAEASLPPPQLTTDVLVAAGDIPAGRVLEPSAVRWEAWPKTSVSSSFIVSSAQPDIEKAVAGIVVRVPVFAGQPIAESFIVRAGSSGLMAATVTPGMRAMAIPVTAEAGVGGFVLPNDRVDVIFTRAVTDPTDNSKRFVTHTLLRDVRVLAIDQSVEQPKDAQAAVGKTATVELSPAQVETIQAARAVGTLSLALRPLGEAGDTSAYAGGGIDFDAPGSAISVIRYGVTRDVNVSEEEVKVAEERPAQ